MQKRLQIALIAASAIATSLVLAPTTHAASNATTPPTTDDRGHKIYVNDLAVPAPRQTFRSQQNRLVFWSTTERRWKTVPHANVQAAKSAADRKSTRLNSS